MYEPCDSTLRPVRELLHIDDGPFVVSFTDLLFLIERLDAKPVPLGRPADVDDFGERSFGADLLPDGGRFEVAVADFGTNRLLPLDEMRSQHLDGCRITTTAHRCVRG